MPTVKRFYDGLDADLKKALLAQIRNLWTHTSTAIEGNTLVGRSLSSFPRRTRWRR
jgi:hypothetical protein